MDWVLRRGRLSGRALEVWLGHATFCAMAERGMLAVFSLSYAFLAAHYWEDAPLWPTVREELEAFRVDSLDPYRRFVSYCRPCKKNKGKQW